MLRALRAFIWMETPLYNTPANVSPQFSKLQSSRRVKSEATDTK